MKKIEKLEWDSNFFGIRVGRVIIDDKAAINSEVFLQEAETQFDLVYVLSYDKLLSTELTVLGKLSLKDIMLTLSMPFNKDQFTHGYYKFRTALDNEELNGCYKIAEQTAVVSRFYSEPIVGVEKTKGLYRRWIDTAIDKTFSDGLFIKYESDEISGIHLIKTDCKNKIGYFTLTGVNPDFKRKGIGRELWMQSFAYWAQEREIDTIKSPFSFQNKESLNFHLKMGFNKVEEIKYIYHWVKKE